MIQDKPMFHTVTEDAGPEVADMLSWVAQRWPPQHNGPRWGRIMLNNGQTKLWFAARPQLIEFCLTWL